MPWSTQTVTAQRQEFITLARHPDTNLSELCRRYRISRKTAYKWLKRDDMRDRSRRPHTSPARTATDIEARVLDSRDRHPAWGGRKIAHVLQRDAQILLAPSTVNSILHRHGRITAQASAAATPWQRFEHPYANDLWQMDFKGHFALREGRCHPLTILDDHSRYNIALQALAHECHGDVQAALYAIFARYGLPLRINADNGTPWGNRGQGGLTRLGVWLIRLGIRLSHSRAAHPQTNGKDERFHRTLKAEVLNLNHFADLSTAQRHFDHWRHVYNHERPHQALDMATPASRYQASPRSLPKQLPPVEYPSDSIVCRVRAGGWISHGGKTFFIGTALSGEAVALRAIAERDGVYAVYFCHHKLGEIHLHDL